MSKRVRTSRVAQSKMSRRPRPSGEREVVAAREGLSSVDFDDARSSAPSEAPESGPTSASVGGATDTDRPGDVAPEVGADAVVPALVTGETPPPAPVSADEIVPANPELTPAPLAVEVDDAKPQASGSKASESKASEAKASEANSDADVHAEAAAAPGAVLVGKKKKKKGAIVGGTRPEDAKASSGALSLNEPLARDFYESAPPPDQHEAHDDEVEAAHAVALSPEILERKARLRRIVMGVFAAASLVVILVAGKTLLAKNAPAPDVSHAMENAPAPKEEAPKVTEPAKPAEMAKPAEVANPPAPVPAPEASAKADEKKEEPKPEEKKEEAPKPSGDPAELKKTASKLYNSGKLKEAIPALRDAIAADPDDALPYLFLGDALTNTGKWPEAKEAYNQCVRNAKKGPKHECAAMGGRK